MSNTQNSNPKRDLSEEGGTTVLHSKLFMKVIQPRFLYDNLQSQLVSLRKNVLKKILKWHFYLPCLLTRHFFLSCLKNTLQVQGNTNTTSFRKNLNPSCFTKVRQLRYISKRFELTSHWSGGGGNLDYCRLTWGKWKFWKFLALITKVQQQ